MGGCLRRGSRVLCNVSHQVNAFTLLLTVTLGTFRIDERREASRNIFLPDSHVFLQKTPSDTRSQQPRPRSSWCTKPGHRVACRTWGRHQGIVAAVGMGRGHKASQRGAGGEFAYRPRQRLSADVERAECWSQLWGVARGASIQQREETRFLLQGAQGQWGEVPPQMSDL